MTGTVITVAGTVVTDVTGYRAQLTATRARLRTIYAGFDPARPEALLPREPEIVDLLNKAERLREIVERWEEAEAKRTNVLTGWDIVRAYDGGEA